MACKETSGRSRAAGRGRKNPRVLAHSQAGKQPKAAPGVAWAKKNTGEKARVANQKTRAVGSSSGGGGGSQREAGAEAYRLGVGPAVWTRVQKYWAKTHDGNQEATLEGYELGMLRRRDLKSLKKGGQLTGDIASEIARRITDSAPQVAFLDDAFLEKVAPLVGGGTRCRSQHWARDIVKGAESQIGTTRTKIVALQYVPRHWCCATADLARRELVYYDPYFPDPDLRALDALDDYVDQVAHGQGGHVEIGAATFKQKLCNTPRHPDNASCGVCVLIEIQRIADGHIDSPRDPRSDAAELLRYRAKWACEIMSNPAPTWNRATRIPAGRQAARATMETDGSDVEMGETRPTAAGKRARAPLSDPRGITKQKRMPVQGGRKRVRSPFQGGQNDAGRRKRQPGCEAPQDTSTGASAPDGAAGIHPQDLSMGGMSHRGTARRAVTQDPPARRLRRRARPC